MVDFNNVGIRNILIISISIWFFICCSCSKNRTIGIQPFEEFSKPLTDTIVTALEEAYGFNVYTLKNQPLPKNTFINVKTPRFRADEIIRILKREKPDSIGFILGLTEKDISTTKTDKYGKIKKPESKYSDWGVFGLGYMPGESCIVSTFRLKTTNKKLFYDRVKKISIHEIGHNLGLKHCITPKCVMGDAVESIKTIDMANKELCDKCKILLQ